MDIDENINIYFLYSPQKNIENDYQLSLTLFSDTTGDNIELNIYNKYNLNIKSEIYNKYILKFDINNKNLKQFTHFFISIQNNNKNEKFNSDFFLLENNKDIFILDFSFSSINNENLDLPKIEQFNFYEIYQYYFLYINNYKENEKIMKFISFLDCLFDSYYQNDIYKMFFTILNDMKNFNNFSRISYLFINNFDKKDLIKIDFYNKIPKVESLIEILNSKEIFELIKNSKNKKNKLSNKFIKIYNNYYSLLFSYYLNKKEIEKISYLIKEANNDKISKSLVSNIILYLSFIFKIFDKKSFFETLEFVYKPVYNIDKKILTSFLNMIEKIEDQIEIIFDNIDLIKKYISNDLKKLIEKKIESPQKAIDITNILSNISNISENLVEKINNFLLVNYINKENRLKKDFHIIYKFNPIKTLENLYKNCKNIKILKNIKDEIIELSKEKKINSNNLIIEINQQIKNKVYEEINKFNEKEIDKIQIANYIKNIIRLSKFAVNDLKEIIYNDDDISNKIIKIINKIDIDVLNEIIIDKKDKDLTEFKFLNNFPNNNYDNINQKLNKKIYYENFLNKIFECFKDFTSFDILFKIFPEFKIKQFPLDKFKILINKYLNLIFSFLTFNSNDDLFIQNLEKICNLINNNLNFKDDKNIKIKNDLINELKIYFENKDIKILIRCYKKFLNIRENIKNKYIILKLEESLKVQINKINIIFNEHYLILLVIINMILDKNILEKENNILIEIFNFIFNNLNISYKENDFYKNEISNTHNLLLKLHLKNILCDEIIEKNKLLNNIIKIIKNIKFGLYNKTIKINDFLKFTKFSNLIFDEKLKLIYVISEKVYPSEEKIKENIKILKNLYNNIIKRIDEIKKLINSYNDNNYEFFKECESNKIIDEINIIKNILDNKSIKNLYENEIKNSENYIKEQLNVLKSFQKYSKSTIYLKKIYEKRINELKQKNIKINYDISIKTLQYSNNIYEKIFKNLIDNNLNKKFDLNFFKNCFNQIDIKNELKIMGEIYKVENINNFINFQFKIIIIIKDFNKTIEKLKNIKIALNIFNIKDKNNLSNQINSILKINNILDLKEIDYKTVQNISNNFDEFLNDENKISKVLFLIGSCSQVFTFIKTKDQETLNAYEEYNNENSEFDSKLLEELKKIFFRNKDLNSKEFKNEIEFINYLKELINNNEYYQTFIYLEEIRKVLYELDTLNTKVNNKEEYNKNKMIRIFEKSIFKFVYDKNKIEYRNYKRDFYKIICFTESDMKKKINQEGNNNIIIIEENELKGLQDRALLKTQKSTIISNKNTEDAKNYKNYDELIKKIFKEKNLLNEAFEKGTILNECYENYVEKGKIIVNKNQENENKNLVDYKVFIEEIENELNKIINSTKEGYQKDFLFTFFFGRQIPNFLNIIENENNLIENKNILDGIIDFDLKDSINETQNFIIKNNNILNNKIDIIIYFLNSFFKNNFFSFEEIYKDHFYSEYNNNEEFQSKENKKILPGIYIYKYNNKIKNNLNEVRIVELNIKLTLNIPVGHCVLICNKNTNSEEIICFIYRFIKCKFKIPFFISNFHLISIENKKKVFSLLEEIEIEKEKEIVNAILIFLIPFENEFEEVIQNYKLFKKIVFEENINKNISFYKNLKLFINSNINVDIIKSNCSGVGKTYLIKSFALKYNFTLFNFPFGFEDTRETILNRFYEKNAEFNKKKMLLHINIYDIKNFDYINEFLFSLLFTKIFNNNEKIYVLKENIKIVIEIPFGFGDFLKKVPILKYFKPKEIKLEKPPKINVTDKENNLKEKCNLICSYLDYLDTKEINTRNLSLNTDLFVVGSNDLEEKKYSKNYDYYSRIVKIFDNSPTYYQFISLVDILYIQLKYFSHNQMFNIKNLFKGINIAKSIKDGEDQTNIIFKIRGMMIEKLIELSKFCSLSAYKNLIKVQEKNINEHNRELDEYEEDYFENNNNDELNIGDINLELDEENEEEKKAKEFYLNENELTFDKLPSGIILFNNDNFSINVVTNSNKLSDEERKIFTTLYNTQTKNESSLPDYKNFSHEKYLEELRKYFDIKPNYILDVPEGYVFTPDNYFKMVMINIKILANVPVILMGETGCGKTFLIRMMSQIYSKKDIKKKDKEKKCENILKIKNIHAGITEDNIIEFMKKEVIPQAMKFDDKNKENRKKNKNEEKIWVFFDEINTSTCMGLIAEIMCNKTMRGELLPKSIIYIAACNPYKRKSKDATNKSYGLVFKKYFKNKDLVYNVLPLIHSLANFIYDFGYLKKEDEKNYIASIIKYIGKNNNNIENNDNNNNDNLYKITYEDVEKMAVEMLSCCQIFIRMNNEIFSVSLRDTRRFAIFYEWFMKIYEIKIEIKDSSVENLNEKHKQIKSIFLTLYLCYILRIPEKEKREDLYSQLFNIYKNFLPDDNLFESENSLLDFIDEELNNLIDRIIINDKGIAKNSALKENIFALFNCIMNHIPIFICGKPGCSKTLSLELLKFSLIGKESIDPLFKKVAPIYIVYFQGSKTTTSKEIEKAFDNAYNYKKNNPKTITIIFFDEMGLAEISDNNPLKILHSKLEYENENEKVSFVGISNWSLDASKQNRGIFIARPDPSESDLIKTAIAISSSYEIIPQQNFYKLIAKSYLEYKSLLKSIIEEEKKNNKNNKLDLSLVDFHGTRDYYNMIKQFSMRIKNNNHKNNIKNDYNEIAKIYIDRNFSGLSFANIPGLKTVGEFFIEKVNDYNLPKYNLNESIKNNINDFDSRYLLLIANNEVGNYLIDNIYKETENKPIFYYGSTFKYDLNREEYSYLMVNKIMVNMEQGNTIVLKNLDNIYPSLFDLFNQHFVVNRDNDMKFCRISIGLINNPRAAVNKKFKVVVLIDTNDGYYQDPPFLNRFEKHYLDFNTLLSEEDKNLANEIYEFLINFVSLKNNKIEGNKINLFEQLVDCSIGEIMGILYKMSKEEPKLEIKEKKNKIISIITQTLSQDIIFYSKLNKIYDNENNKKMINLFYFNYNKNVKMNFIEFIQEINVKKHVIYTFSKHYQQINLNDKIDNNKLKIEFYKEDFFIINLAEIKNQENFELILYNYYKSNKKVLIIKFKENDNKHINFIINYIKNFELNELDKNQKEKIIILIIYLKRKFIEEKEEIIKEPKHFVSHLLGYNQIFIDNLNSCLPKMNFNSLLNNNNNYYQLFELIDFEKNIEQILTDTYITFDFKIKKENYIENTINKLIINYYSRKIIIDNFQNEIINKTELLEYFVRINSIRNNDLDILSRFKKFLNNIILHFSIKFFYFLEKYSNIDFLLVIDEKSNDKIKIEIDNLIKRNEFKAAEIKINPMSNKIIKVEKTNIFNSYDFFNKIIEEISNNKLDEFIQNEKILLIFKNEEDEDKIKKKYKNNFSDIIKITTDNIQKIINKDEFDTVKKSFDDDVNFNFLLSDLIKFILKENNISEFCDIFIKYIFDDKLKNYFKQIYNNYDKENKIEYFCYIIFYIKCYLENIKNYIDIILKISSFLNKKQTEIFKEIIIDFKNEKINVKFQNEFDCNIQLIRLLEESKFYLLFNYLKNVNKENFFKFYNFIDEIYENSIVNNNNIKNKKIEEIKMFLTFSKLLPKDENFEKYIKNYISNILKENELIKNLDEKELNNIINNELNMFENILKNNKNSINIIMKILTNKIQNLIEYDAFANNINYILIIIMNNTNYLLNSLNLFKIIFGNIFPNKINKLEENRLYYNEICKSLKKKNYLNSKILNVIIFEIFDENNQCFLNEYLKGDEIKENLICDNNLELDNDYNYNEEENKNNKNGLYYFKNFMEKLNNNNTNNYEILKIFYISYIKLYFFYISKIYVDKYLYQKYRNINLFENELNKIKDIKILFYFVKSIKYRLKGFNKFSSYDFEFYNNIKNIFDNYFNNLDENILYNPINFLYIYNIDEYMKLNNLFNNFQIEEKQIITISNNDNYNFFDFIFDRYIICNLTKNLKQYNKYEKNWIKKKLNVFFNNSNEIIDLLNKILENNYEFNFKEEELNLLSICFKYYFLFKIKFNKYIDEINDIFIQIYYKDLIINYNKLNISHLYLINKSICVFIIYAIYIIKNFDNLKINKFNECFKILNEIIVKLQIKMKQNFNYDNINSFIYSILFDFRKENINFNGNDINEILFNNIEKFLLNKNNEKSLNIIEKKYYEYYSKIIPIENNKNVINEIFTNPNYFDFYKDKNIKEILIKIKDKWFIKYIENIKLYEIMKILIKYIIPFLISLEKILKNKVNKNLAKKNTIKKIVEKNLLEFLYNNFKNGIDMLKSKENINFEFNDDSPLINFLFTEKNPLFEKINFLIEKYNELISNILNDLNNNKKLLQTISLNEIKIENIFPSFEYNFSTDDNEINLEKLLLNFYHNYLIVNKNKTSLSFKLNKKQFFENNEFEKYFKDLFSNKFLIKQFSLFEFDILFGKTNIIIKFKKKYPNIEKIDEQNKKFFSELIKINSEEAEKILKQFYYILFYIIQKKNITEMYNISNEIPNNYKIHEKILNEITSKLNIENLLDLLELIEKICYKKIEGEINNKFKNKDDIEEEKEKILEEIQNNETLKKENFIDALRRFILRIIYENDDFDENDNIINSIVEDIYWNENINKKEIQNLKKFNIKAKNIIHFYNSLQNQKKEKKKKKINNKKDDY